LFSKSDALYQFTNKKQQQIKMQVLESPAFLSKPCDRLEPFKIGRVPCLGTMIDTQNHGH
jgi:hypothetical protein